MLTYINHTYNMQRYFYSQIEILLFTIYLYLCLFYSPQYVFMGLILFYLCSKTLIQLICLRMGGSLADQVSIAQP